MIEELKRLQCKVVIPVPYGYSFKCQVHIFSLHHWVVHTSF